MQQRVGIARALANYPRVLLMDEPFGALDSQTRSLMQENLLALWRDLHITVVFVTHDIDEAVLLADRILVMGSNPGHVVRSLDVSLPRPRSSASTLLPEFLSLRKQCLDLIRDRNHVYLRKLSSDTIFASFNLFNSYFSHPCIVNLD